MQLANNEVIRQFRALHNVAMDLKEKFDLYSSPDVLHALSDQYGRELERLTKMIPREVMSKTDLMRHSLFLNRYINEEKFDSCYSDIQAICGTDIFETEEAYFHYLDETQDIRVRDLDWSIIHPVIYELAKPRFEQELFSDAIEAAFKEINSKIKGEYKTLKAKEFDGDQLMRHAFSTSKNNDFNPVFHLADNDTESGRNKQDGYMNIFAGVMRGIRNPHAHSNVNLNVIEAWELLIVASHLMRIWDDRQK
jgi:uncharacterized protein (TIGR02391 family)